MLQGGDQWTDLVVSADVRIYMARSAGLAARVQGLRRRYEFLIDGRGGARIVRHHDAETVTLAQARFQAAGDILRMTLTVDGERIVGAIDGREVVSANDATFGRGGIGLVVEEGTIGVQSVSVQPALGE